MKKTIKTVSICSRCRSINIQAKVWVNLNGGSIDWDGSSDLHEFYCPDCDTHADTYTITNIKTVNGAVKIAGYQVKDQVGNLHPDMANNKSLYNLEQAQEMIAATGGNDMGYDLFTVYPHDFEGQVKMF